jgi:SAM-dependent methyltransferase
MVAQATVHNRATVYDFEEGFGSVYGRYVRKRLSLRLLERYQIRSVLEAPCNAESYFASPGTQSIVFGRAGCEVALLHDSPEIVDKTREAWSALGLSNFTCERHQDFARLPCDDGSFDLVWNFDTLPLMADPAACVAEMVRVSRSVILTIVPNRTNVGYPIHALKTLVARTPSPWGSARWMAVKPVRSALEAAGARVRETGPIDIPPWPGFDAMGVLGRAIRKKRVGAAPPASDAEVEKMLRKFTVLEYSRIPAPLKLPMAHQLYVLAEKPNA